MQVASSLHTMKRIHEINDESRQQLIELANEIVLLIICGTSKRFCAFSKIFEFGVAIKKVHEKVYVER